MTATTPTSSTSLLLKDELNFVDVVDNGEVVYSAQQQAEDFWNYVNNDKYLKNHKGEYAQRNAGLMPWLHRFDFRYAQDYDIKIGQRNYGLQLSVTVLNIGNLFKSTWGAYRTSGLTSYDNVQILQTTSKVGEKLEYQVNAESHEEFIENTRWTPETTTGSAWQIQFGCKDHILS